jgi:hypothetical protein
MPTRPTRKKKRLTKEVKERTYAERQQRLIDTFQILGIKLIQDSERLLEECLRQFEEVQDPKLKKRYRAMIKSVEKNLLALRNKTQEVLRNIVLMQKGLDSLK